MGVVLVSALLASAPLVSLIDGALGSYAIAILIIVFALYRTRLKAPLPPLDIGIVIAAIVILVSPYWSMILDQRDMNVTSPTLGAALAVAYVLPLRWYIGNNRQRFTTYVQILIVAGVVLAWIVQSSGVETRISSTASRLFVDFANANFVGAVLSTCASFALYLALWRRYNPLMRFVMLLVAAGLCYVIFQTGSRASLGGVAIALVGMILLRRAPGVYRWIALLVMIAGFVIGLLPDIFNSLLGSWAGAFSNSSTLGRAEENLADASGRLELWNSAWAAFQQSPLFGWGPGVYGALFDPGGVPAHSWSLEILAGLGLLGALVFVPLIFRAFLGGVPLFRRGKATPFGTQSKVWNATTALAIMPSMILSTHQWNVWAWAVIGLWTCSLALDDPDAAREEPLSEVPSHRA